MGLLTIACVSIIFLLMIWANVRAKQYVIRPDNKPGQGAWVTHMEARERMGADAMNAAFDTDRDDAWLEGVADRVDKVWAKDYSEWHKRTKIDG